ncbi:type II secretion system protein [Frigoribacterium sp. PvP032]|uniref:type II secretion system protein n=1 Tax=Frigoribacterium sp. PvP032 TaxID=2806589 RepID=UPI001AE80E69|nr:prepilin-type N-terminal cleavage/methylation domain-containing protein [Frigoribacterium sp. PvP032]MBP1191960.1 prepilin-type N-terminal cleavage/methylation domain-containing protein [Frigoribacterium sp. PvP032]
MYFALMGKLSARRQNLAQDKDKGFTLIELLVVVIIIGILAAIAIPVYLNVTNNAKDSGVKSDATNVKTAIISVQSSTGTLPAAFSATKQADIASDLVSAGASMGDNTTALAYTLNATKDKFCIQTTSTTGKTFGTTDAAGTAQGTCSAGVFTKTAGS